MRTEKGTTDLIAGILISSKNKSEQEIAKEIIKTLKEENNLNIPPLPYNDIKSSILLRIMVYEKQIKRGKKSMLASTAMIQNNKIQRLKELRDVLRYYF